MSPTVRKITAALLLVLGVQLWLIVGRSQWGNLPHWMVWVAILAVLLVPAANRWIVRAHDCLAQPSPRMRRIVSVIIAVAAGSYLYFTAVRQQRDFFPKILDEGSYAIVGGTGRYAGASGTYTARQSLRELGGDGTAEFTLNLTALEA